MKNLCSPFALCKGFGLVNLPRMTVRGQSVQGVCVLLRAGVGQVRRCG